MNIEQDLLRQNKALAAELASQVAWKERYMRDLLEGAERIRELEAWLRRGIDLMEYSHEQRGLCPDDEHEWMERAETMIRSGPESVPNSALRLTAETK